MKLIIKFGGSVITRKYKKGFPLKYEEIEKYGDKFVRKFTIKRLIREIYQVYKESPFNFVLINGAGPFGHLLVYEYLRNKKVEIETIHKSVALLNSKIIKELERYFPVTIIHPFETCYYENGEFDIRKMEETVKNSFEDNKVVSTYGDIIPAKEGRLGKFHIISGDDIAINLATKIRADKIIMVTDVDGVFTKNPILYKDAKLIPKLNPNFINMDFTRDKSIDVTGGMESKIRKLIAAAEEGIESYIINGFEKNNLSNILHGKKLGTLISL